MKQISRILIPVLVLATLLISACASAPVSNSGGVKVQAAPVEFTGVIETIDGNQWTIDGQTITVDPAVVHDGPFNVGDTVKVEVDVQQDGSMVVTRVEIPHDDDNEAFGSVDSIDGNTIVIGGQTFTIADGAEFDDQVAVGDFVKAHFTLNADGTMSITEIELSDQSMADDDDADDKDDGDEVDDDENEDEDDDDEDDDDEDDDDEDDDDEDDD